MTRYDWTEEKMEQFLQIIREKNITTILDRKQIHVKSRHAGIMNNALHTI